MTSGFLILKTFDRTLDEFVSANADRISENEPFAIPRSGKTAYEFEKRYRGINRDPLEAWSEDDLRHGLPNVVKPSEPAAHLKLHELMQRGGSTLSLIKDRHDAEAVFGLLQDRSGWEMIWADSEAALNVLPRDNAFLGFEPATLDGDYFSPVCDTVCFPRWHGTAGDDHTLQDFFGRLNANALFDHEQDARAFRDYYTSLQWGYRGKLDIVGVFLTNSVPPRAYHPRAEGGADHAQQL